MGWDMERLQEFLDFVWTTPSFPSDFTGWDFFNSNLLLAIVGAAFTVVFRQESQKQRQNENLNLENEVQKSREENETQDAAISAAQDKPNLQIAAKIIRTLKDAIEHRASEDGRFKRTYDKIARYDYIPLIEAMESRNLKDGSAAPLKQAFELFKPYKNGRNEVPPDVLEKLQQIMAALREIGFVKPVTVAAK